MEAELPEWNRTVDLTSLSTPFYTGCGRFFVIDGQA